MVKRYIPLIVNGYLKKIRHMVCSIYKIELWVTIYMLQTLGSHVHMLCTFVEFYVLVFYTLVPYRVNQIESVSKSNLVHYKCFYKKNVGAQDFRCRFSRDFERERVLFCRSFEHIFRIVIVIWFLWKGELMDKLQRFCHNMDQNIATRRS